VKALLSCRLAYRSHAAASAAVSTQEDAKKLADAAVDVLWGLYSAVPPASQAPSNGLRRLLACVDSLARQSPGVTDSLQLRCLTTANYMLLDHLTEVSSQAIVMQQQQLLLLLDY
jgi:hypothetical protein